MNKHLRSIIRIMASLKIAIVILILIAIYSIVGTLLPQHRPSDWYVTQYPTMGPVINLLSLSKAYSSPVFSLLLGLFIVNLSACTLLSLKGQLRQSAKHYYPQCTSSEHVIENVESEKISTFFSRKRYAYEKTQQGFKVGKFRWGILGSTITHLGIIILFAGGIWGNVSAKEDFISLQPGQEIYFDAKGFSLLLDDFTMTFDDNGSVAQYYSTFTITEDDGTVSKETIWVNKPLTYHGIQFYQASFGWMSNLRISDRNSGEVLIEGFLQNEKSYFYQPKHLTIFLHAYYPEMGIGHTQEPVLLSNRETNPHYAVVLYNFGEPIGSYILGPNESIPYEDIDITFSHSVAYTGILLRTDSSFLIVLLGFVIIMLGMFVSFYLYPRFAEYRDGKLFLFSKKNEWIFFNTISNQLQKSQKSSIHEKRM
jgi:cytochrome c biogenesis protein